MLGQPLAEVQVVLYAVLGNIKQDIICSLWICETKSELAQSVAEKLLHVSVVRLQLFVIAVREE